jgi:hypothetical protein
MGLCGTLTHVALVRFQRLPGDRKGRRKEGGIARTVTECTVHIRPRQPERFETSHPTRQFYGTNTEPAASFSMERRQLEKKLATTFVLEKLGRGIRILSENVETPRLPSRMKELLARLERVPEGADPQERKARRAVTHHRKRQPTK